MEVGDYVRFKDKRGNTYIRKVIDGYKAHWYGCKVDKEANNVPYVSAKNIIKSSPNIIDLIEVGDYVDGEKVDSKDEENVYVLGDFGYYAISKKSIKSVLTKEQFESIEYRIGE